MEINPDVMLGKQLTCEGPQALLRLDGLRRSFIYHGQPLRKSIGLDDKIRG
jgi:hypothetical protein